MQLLRAQLNAMHDIHKLVPAIHQLRVMQEELAPVLHEVQAWQQNVRLEHMLKQQEEYNRVVNYIRLEVQRSTSSQE